MKPALSLSFSALTWSRLQKKRTIAFCFHAMIERVEMEALDFYIEEKKYEKADCPIPF